MKKRFLGFILALSLAISLLSFPGLADTTGSDDSNMDALAALGVDSSKAPDGYDASSTDNPYGRDTIEISPVYELYKVGLQNGVSYDASYTADSTSALQDGTQTAQHTSAAATDALQSSLYGNNVWGKGTTVGDIMSSGTPTTANIGTTPAAAATSETGDYTLITNGNVNAADTPFPAKGYLKNPVNAASTVAGAFQFGLSSVAAGNFDGNTSGLAAQTAMVYTSDYSADGGIYLRFGNAQSGTYGANAKELLSPSKQIGNPTLTYEGKLVENFAENPYQLQNYLQVATGDWNGDGMDEVAVYIPEVGGSRIVVFALQLTNADDRSTAYLDSSKWAVVWSYYLHEGSVVSNMVSLTNGDVNQDGVDDLAATWGYYYGPTQNIGSTAVVMFGAKGTSMLNSSQQFDLKYGASNIVRASFAFGDMAGSGADVLVLCGQSDSDLAKENTGTRYVALYNWDGTKFTTSVYKNFDLLAKDDKGNFVNAAMQYYANGKPRSDFYSLPLCAANTALISQGITGGGDLLYFDSLIVEYTKDGLSIKEAWDTTRAMQDSESNLNNYVEYGAVAGDMTGVTGNGTLVTMTQTLSSTSEQAAQYTVTGTHKEPAFSWESYYRNWLHKIFKIRSWRLVFVGETDVSTTEPVNVNYEQFAMGSARMVTVDRSSSYISRTNTDFSASICLANTDKDSSYMNYSGRHYFTYTDPQVLSVLASPPYFSDLMNRDDLSGNYSNSQTSYSSSSGSGSGYTASATIKVGAYVSYEHEFQILGVTIAKVQAEATVTAGFTFETEKTSTLEQKVTYIASAGEDTVAFYSIPMEIYQYKSYVANGSGGYDEILTTVNLPHEAAVRVLSLDEYESIAKDYSVLPKIAGNVLTHTVGVPSTYPSSTAGYNVIAEYKGDPSAVGFSSAAGGAGINQEIEMSSETNNAFIGSASVEAKAGAGPGDLVVGVVAGVDAGAGSVTISTSGSSFSGEMQNMPIEAQGFGYGMNWRIFCYKYGNGSTSFPVVSYVVSDVTSPPQLPADFEQDVPATTSGSITLKWSYNKLVSGFRIYRYYEFPDGTGSYQIESVPFTNSTYDANTGIYHFTYTDKDLSPYTEYQYQIKTVCADNPKESIYSEPLSCRTKSAVGYPSISLGGLVDGLLPIYPDADSTVSANVANPENYKSLSYQWQKQIDGVWTNISGKTSSSLTISNAGVNDDGLFRCRVNTIYYDSGSAQNYYISAYSDAFKTAYSKRTPTGTLTAAEAVKPDDQGTIHDGLSATIELFSGNENHSTAPAGTVVFTVKGTDYATSQAALLEVSTTPKVIGKESKYYSTAALDIRDLPEGVYTVTAYYSGNKVFKDSSFDKGELVVIGDGSAYSMALASSSGGDSVTKFEYGNSIYTSVCRISKDAAGKMQSEPVTAGVTYTLVPDAAASGTAFASGGLTPDVGKYTMRAEYAGEAVAAQSFTVNQKPITVKVENQPKVDAGTVTENPPIISCADISGDALAALKLGCSVLNSAGKSWTLNNDTDPGNYTVTACSSQDTPVTLYNDYSITYVSGIYTIIGATYPLTIEAVHYTDEAGTRAVGKAGISNVTGSSNKYSAETNVTLYALPEKGYQVDTWTATFDSNPSQPPQTQSGDLYYTIRTQACPVKVTVTFKPTEQRLFATAQPAAGGSITCTDKNFSSGAYVSSDAAYHFIAAPNKGYHFSKWSLISDGSPATPAGTSGSNGSSETDIKIGTAASNTLFAIFERDSYKLNLGGDVVAYYMFDDDGVSTTPPIKKYISSGSSVAGDTEITVMPKIGYQAADGAFFKVNDTDTTDSASHKFVITEDTTVSLQTQRNQYAVTTAAENGSVTAAVNGTVTSTDGLKAVEGGSPIVFTAHADRGYVFDHWIKDGTAIAGNTATLTISEIGADTAVTAVFVPNTPYAASAVVNSNTRGTMKYTLYDIYGDVVGEADTLMPGAGVTVYKGESIIFTVSLTPGSMMEQWVVDGTNIYTTQRTYQVNSVSADINATAYLKAASSYKVNYLAMGSTGSTLTAANDGAGFDSGTLQYGGSAVDFCAEPADGIMLDHWTETVGDITATENSESEKTTDGDTLINPVLSIDPLRQNITVRAYFTALAVNKVTLPASTAAGISLVTYVTPIKASDSGVRSLTSEDVRTGGTAIMTFTPSTDYTTSAARIKAAILNEVKSGAASVSVTENAGVFTATVKNLSEPIALAEPDIYSRAYKIVVPAGVTASLTKAAEGQSVTLTVQPASGKKLSALTLDNGKLIEDVSSSRLVYTFAMPAADVSVSAEFADIPSGGGGSAGRITVPISGNGSSIDAGIEIKEGTATLKLEADDLGGLISGSGVLAIDLSKLEDVTGTAIPAETFKAISDAAQKTANPLSALAITLQDAGISFDAKALTAISAAGKGDVCLTATTLKPSDLTDDQKALVGDRPVIDLALTIGGKRVPDFGEGSAQVSVRYTLKPGENPESIVVWFLNDKGVLESVTGSYNGERGCVVFTTGHFSKFVLGYMPFNDVSRDEWYFDSVSFAYGNGLFSGVTDSAFAPRTTMTRAMLVTVLWQMEGKPQAKKCTFRDVLSDRWYSNAVAWATDNGIISGYGGGLFGTDDPITREQMAVILMNYSKYKGYDVSGSVSLDNFTDNKSISSWASSALKWASAEGLIKGMGNDLIKPGGSAQRCQVAAILQSFSVYAAEQK